jgi:hypothetical protein
LIAGTIAVLCSSWRGESRKTQIAGGGMKKNNLVTDTKGGYSSVVAMMLGAALSDDRIT